MRGRRSRIGRLVAALFIRGAEAPFTLRDLEDSFNHDVARGAVDALELPSPGDPDGRIRALCSPNRRLIVRPDAALRSGDPHP